MSTAKYIGIDVNHTHATPEDAVLLDRVGVGKPPGDDLVSRGNPYVLSHPSFAPFGGKI